MLWLHSTEHDYLNEWYMYVGNISEVCVCVQAHRLNGGGGFRGGQMHLLTLGIASGLAKKSPLVKPFSGRDS